MHNDILTIGGKRLSDFQCWHDGSQVFRRASKQIEKYSIPGRSGDLAFSLDRHENLTIPFNCFIKENFRENYTALMDYLNNLDGYVELRTTEEPNHFREALFHASTIPEMNPFNQSGQFTLEFDCKPQLWLDDGQRRINFASRNDVFNPTYSIAKPTFILQGPCNLYIRTDNGVETGNLTISDNRGPIYIDVIEDGAVDAYLIIDNEKVSVNNSVSFTLNRKDFRLQPGHSKVFSSSSSKIVIPRWYRL